MSVENNFICRSLIRRVVTRKVTFAFSRWRSLTWRDRGTNKRMYLYYLGCKQQQSLKYHNQQLHEKDVGC